LLTSLPTLSSMIILLFCLITAYVCQWSSALCTDSLDCSGQRWVGPLIGLFTLLFKYITIS
jgi:hypothetical protein